ncbi:MAG: chemotaxis protein CheD [Candidatus Natronoplasma sp.]
MTEEKEIKIGEMEVTNSKKILTARALGSCIAVAIYDRQNEVGGMAHVLLGSGNRKKGKKSNMYADKAIKNMIKEIASEGGKRANLKSKIAGGASMFSSNSRGVGQSNIDTVKKELEEREIPIEGKDVGGTHARNVSFKIGSMSMKVEVKI